MVLVGSFMGCDVLSLVEVSSLCCLEGSDFG